MSYLVTGACGCIGSWVIQQLLEAGETVVAFDLTKNTRRMEQIMSPDQLGAIQFVEGDITDEARLSALIEDRDITRIIHLAALQVPACKANPDLGRRVNVGGTCSVFEAARRHRGHVAAIAFASSGAVFGPKEMYQPLYGQDPVVPNDAPQWPQTVYGETKKQNEIDAIGFSESDGIPRLGLRPWTVYGPGRDFGLTSGPTKAMKAAVVGRPYCVGFGRVTDMQYVGDIARAFIQLARQDRFRGAKSYNIQADWVEVPEILRIIEELVPSARGTLSYKDVELQIVAKLDDAELRQEIPGIVKTPLREGIRQTIDLFHALHRDGRLDQSDLNE
ncbi:MAG: NAD(P)-dependent oxidoreductase [Planctomycetes bacterium]|nr:NAD(P)-dependent oxidoreductase [Planctomycetota bacterium]